MPRPAMVALDAAETNGSDVEAVTSALREMMAESMIFHKTEARRHGLTFLQLLLLRSIEARGPMAPSEVAAQFGISRPAVTASLNLLEAGGWIARKNTPDDRRSRRTELRPPALRLMRQLEAERRDFLAQGLEGLSRADRLSFARTIGRIALSLRRRREALVAAEHA